MKIIICDNYDEMSRRAAEMVIAEVAQKPDSVLGLATGSTPVGMYKILIEAYKQGKVDFSRVVTFNLDEYYQIRRDNPNSFWQTMRRNLFSGVNFLEENINILNCEGDDFETFCEEYEQKIKEVGGIDLQILGIGHNAHLGFNEPGSSFSSRTRKVALAASTIEANSRHFKKREEVPREALTMGLGTIMEARKIILLANGAGKAEAVAGAVAGEVSIEVPASILQRHQEVTFILEKEAGNSIKARKH